MENTNNNNDEFLLKEKFNQYFWMIIIFIASIVALAFLPIIGGPIDKIGFFFPETLAGWVIWGMTKGTVAALNLVIFICFTNQGKRNIKENKNYLKALEIIKGLKEIKEKTARSPQKFSTTIYGKKIFFIILFTAGSTFAFEQAILGYNWQNALIYGFTIIMGIVMGLINMKTVETYWTEEFLTYAEQVKHKEDMKLIEEKCNKQRNDSLSNNSGSDILKPKHSNWSISDNNRSMVLDSIRVDSSILSGTVHSSSAFTDRPSTTAKEGVSWNQEN